jgi:hypothetical protein
MVWKSFTISDCVNIVAAAKEEVQKSTLNGYWRNIWPSVVLDKNQALPAIEDEYQRIINLAHSVEGEGFEYLAVEELRELTVESELNSNADLDEDDIAFEALSATTSFNSKAIGEHLTMATKAVNFFLENDPSPELGHKFHREFKQTITWFKEIHNNF